MRLKAIRLAGFKSFVDPTTVPFSTNMTGIVGPNGCGKSNTIDAVRWVMGESSAKYLRGDAMTDVIFNGSSERKPVSKASVDLIFDNSDRSLKGEMAAYNEINVRRQVTREGQSTYYLNGTKCRRKDVTDLFLGTGLGPRSYAIIEQGMISRLIEAKPEELRVYVEEAAGISKYKERRRETENRMRRTHENLERLADIREELERQLAHLQRQAQSAEKYKLLKQEERTKKAELQALKWQTLTADYEQRQLTIQQKEVEQTKFEAELTAAETGLESLKQDHHSRTDEFNNAQAKYYEVGAKIARFEQKIEHQSQLTLQLDRDLADVEKSLLDAQRALEEDQLVLEELAERTLIVEPEWELVEATIEELSERLLTADDRMQNWQSEWEAFTQRAGEPTRLADVAQSRIQASEQQLQRLMKQQERFNEEEEVLAQDPDAEAINALSEDVKILTETLEEHQLRSEEESTRVETQREHLERIQSELNEKRSRLQKNQARLSTLEALQAAIQSTDSEATTQWLESRQLLRKPRLIESIQVSDGWELAVEAVLCERLQSIMVDDLAQKALSLETLTEGQVTLWQQKAVESETVSFETKDTNKSQSIEAGTVEINLPRLSQYVQDTHHCGIRHDLEHVFAADTLTEALEQQKHLRSGQQIVTRAGMLVGTHWVSVTRDSGDGSGILARQQEMEKLLATLDEEELIVEELEAEQNSAQLLLRQTEQQREVCRREWQGTQQKLSAVQSQLAAKQAKLEQLNVRRQRLDQERQEVLELLELEREQIAEQRLIWQEAMAAVSDDTDERDRLQQRKTEVQHDVTQARDLLSQQQEKRHRLQLDRQQIQTKEGALTAAVERLAMQIQGLQQRKASILDNQQRDHDADLDDLKAALEVCLEQRVEAEHIMSTTRHALEEVDTQLRHFEQQRNDANVAITNIRSELEKVRMECQALDIRRQSLVEQLEEDDLTLKDVLSNLDNHADAEVWQHDIQKIGEKIQRLGAINLAAIDEFKLQSERKVYLDEQNADLEKALSTLEGAIQKIDRETRHRFQETFDRMNTGLAELFPKVFGGGHACLELTGDDLLTTGVAIMARPPGKKNSTIHLLSGGEKALTAIALVFSIFQLNPAPFCMLDEVDAPLDDANVGRYANLVKAMSDKVQFIYITHNKIAMEKAAQLMGVTMHEPGVSRLVSVDVEEAAEMIEA